jgi:phosphatidate cytidylyltransferase
MKLIHWMHLQGLTGLLFAVFLAVLVGLTVLSWLAKRLGRPTGRGAEALRRLDGHLRNLWGTVAIFSLAMLTGGWGTLVVFAVSSFLLLREFITISPTRRADHHTLFWLFFVVLPLQYVLLGYGWYGLFVIFIPVYCFLFLPIQIASLQDTDRFLERAAKMQWAMMICIYCVSYAPALMKLQVPGHEGVGARLLLFLCLVIETNNTAHECVDVFGRWPISPGLKGGATVEGFAGGLAAAAILGALLAPVTPLGVPQAAAMAVLIGLLGSAGQLCLTAIRNERGRDSVVVVRRSHEIMPRVISLCFAAPVFFHLIRYFFGGGAPNLF